MAFVVEDGTGLETANSYASFATYQAYFAERGGAASAVQADVEKALVKATDYLDTRYCWRGSKLSSEQALQWPRACVYGEPTFDEPGGAIIEGVPTEVVKACCELANRAISGALAPDPAVDASGQTLVSSKRKVGPIEVASEFNGGGSSTWVNKYPAVDALLKRLTQPPTRSVYRA